MRVLLSIEGIRFDDGHEMDDMTEYELRYKEDEVLVAAAEERDRLWKLHTGLRQAANHGHMVEATELMKEEGIDINNKDGAGWSALAWACKMGRLEMARYLLTVGADIDSTDNVWFITPCCQYLHLHVHSLLHVNHVVLLCKSIRIWILLWRGHAARTNWML